MTYRSNAGRGRAAQVARHRRAVAQAAAREAAGILDYQELIEDRLTARVTAP